jgi:CHAD domain-containing protein
MEKVLAAHHDSGIASHLHWQRKQLKKLIYLFRQLPDNPKEWKSSITIKLENLDEKLGAWHDLHVLLEFIREFAGHHSRGHTPYWLPRITRAVVTEQISILESFNASKK